MIFRYDSGSLCEAHLPTGVIVALLSILNGQYYMQVKYKLVCVIVPPAAVCFVCFCAVLLACVANLRAFKGALYRSSVV